MVAVAMSRPIEARLRRAGRLTERTATALLLGRFSVLCCLGALILGADAPFIAGVTMLGLRPSVLLSRFTLDLLREQTRQRREAATR